MPDPTPLEEARHDFWQVAYRWATPMGPQQESPDLLAALERVEAEAKAEAVELLAARLERSLIAVDQGIGRARGIVAEARRALSTGTEPTT